MARRYKYKHIDLYNTWGTWQADYVEGKLRLALHRACYKTKASAMVLAKEMVDYLNGKENEVWQKCK